MTRGCREGERGEAVTEFVVLVVAIMVPVAYLVVIAMTVQAAMTASGHAVREAGRAFVLAASTDDGARRARAAAAIALGDQGFPLPAGSLAIACEACLAPGSEAAITLDWTVPLPLVPVIGDSAGIPIHASHVVRIDDYR